MSNINIIKSIIQAHEKYTQDKRIEDFQLSLESSVSALEGIEHNKLSEIKKIVNEVEYARFLFSEDEKQQKVKEAISRLMGIWYLH